MLIRIISLVFLLIFSSVEIALGDNDFIYPKNKPSIFKKKLVDNISSANKQLPEAKPKIIQKNKKISEFTIPQKKPLKREKLEVKQEKPIVIQKEKKPLTENIVKKSQSLFLLPKKKPTIYRSVEKDIKSSTVLNDKDFKRAKEVFINIKKNKWSNAFSQTKKIKDKEFTKLVNWMYLKRTSNNATFNDYQRFINENDYYPRISRLKYLAEHKIILKNTTPRTIINWFEKNPPLSGTGKVKLAEAFFKIGENNKAIDG